MASGVIGGTFGMIMTMVGVLATALSLSGLVILAVAAFKRIREKEENY